MQTKKILLQINSVVNFGSTGRIAEELGQVAIADGWESYIAYGRNERLSKSKLIRIGTDWDIKSHVLQTRLFDRHGLGSLKATNKLIEQIKLIKPDIIHLNNLHGYYLNIKVLFKYLSVIEIPVLWTIYDCWPMTGHCAYFDLVDCDKWKTKCYSCPQLNKYPASFLLDRSKKNYVLKNELFNSVKNLTIISNSKWLGSIISQSYLRNYPVKIINSGINIDDFRPVQSNFVKDKYNLHEKFIILGVASEWDQRKGLEDFLELNKKLDSNYQIILVGLNKSQIKCLPQNIIGITKTESVQELATYYSNSDIFINPTWEDNFPTTNLEALACGTPVITYNTGGSPEAIDSDTGFVVEKGDIQGLINAINTIKEKGKSFYSTACRARAEQLYDKNDRYIDYIRLYKSLLAL